jgi:glucokinase
VCNCGNIGCLETEGSTWALEGIVKRTPGYDTSALSGESEIGFHTVFKLAEEGDALAGEVSRQILKAWSLGIINLIHAYDPERVVIGGGVMRSKEIILPVIRETIRRHSWLRENEPDIVAAEQPDFAGILGMSHLVSVSRDKHISLL